MLGLGAQADEEESDSLFATLYVGVASSTWLTLIAGQSSSPADRADIEADTLAIGVDHAFENVGFTLGVEHWGDPGALETEDLAGSVYFDRDRWRISLGLETRDIEIPFTLTGPLGGTFTRTVDWQPTASHSTPTWRWRSAGACTSGSSSSTTSATLRCCRASPC